MILGNRPEFTLTMIELHSWTTNRARQMRPWWSMRSVLLVLLLVHTSDLNTQTRF